MWHCLVRGSEDLLLSQEAGANAGRDLFDKCPCNVFLISITPVSKKEEILQDWLLRFYLHGWACKWDINWKLDMFIEKDRKYSLNSIMMYAFKHALKHEISFPRSRQNPDVCVVCVKLSTPHSQFLIVPYITAPCSHSPWCTAASFMGTNRIRYSCFGLWDGIKRGDKQVLCSRGSLIPSSSWSKDPSVLSVLS